MFDALAASDPHAGLAWLQRRRRQDLLTALAAHTGPLTHNALDQLGTPQAVRALRSILVNTGVLPWRDEILTGLEQWLNSTIAYGAGPAERQLLRSYATWHHVRRLRAASARQPLTFAQSRYVRRTITASTQLLTWLRDRDRTLATCTQADVDAWLTNDTRHDTRGFLIWAVDRGHARHVHMPAFETTKTYQTMPDQDQRWTLVRWLLHEDALDTSDRVAGLLVLLFAQHLSTITRLTTGQNTTTAGGTVKFHLGAMPLTLPDPLGDLALRLAANRRGHAAVGHHDHHPWLFPGGTLGQPLSAAQLARRLKPLGITARTSRNTALMDLAAHLPAAVLSQLLGLSIGRATHWTGQAGNTRPGYAAAVARGNF